jgi:hypothetical protein
LDEYSSNPVRISQNNYYEEASIAIYKNNIYAVWVIQNFEESIISYSISSDNGASWSEPINLSKNTDSAHDPDIAVYENNIHVVWTDYRDGFSEIYYKKSTDNSKNWENETRLTNTTNEIRENTIYDLGIGIDNNNIYISWKDYRIGTSEIHFLKSLNNGDTWETEKRLTNDYSPSYYPSFSIDENNIYLVYQDGGGLTDICFLKSESQGESWSEKQILTDTNSRAKKPDIAISENNIFVVWWDNIPGNNEIYFKKSEDRGETWLETRQLTQNSINSINPQIYAYNNEILIIWQDEIDDISTINYLISNDSGKTWSQRKKIDTDIDSYDVKIIGEGNNIHILYQKYFSGSRSELWHISNQFSNPIISEINISNNLISKPGSSVVKVQGYDINYNNSELSCNIQYQYNQGEWQDLNNDFIDGIWQAEIDFEDNSKNGEYNVRAKLKNPDNYESDWLTGEKILININNASNNTAGFELFILIFTIIVLFIIFRWRK